MSFHPDIEELCREPEGFAWGEHRAADGARLRWGRLDAAGPPLAECVLACGFKEYVEKYFETLRDLSRLGLSVWCLDWRGQGASERPRFRPTRPRSRDFDRDAADLVGFAEAVFTGTRPRVLVGHSMGGAVALLALHQRPNLFDAAILSAPMLGIRTGPVSPAGARRIAGALRRLGLGGLFVPGGRRWTRHREMTPALSRTSNDPRRCRVHEAWYAAQPGLRVDDATFGWLDAALRLTARLEDEALLRAIRTPILMASPGLDVLVRPDSHRRAARLLPDCTLIDLPTSKHEPFHEVDEIRDEWLAAIEEFLTSRFGDARGEAVRPSRRALTGAQDEGC
jgi:lysophospholipase